eukprot:2803370-Amphidinium_carterae.2
MPCREQAVFDTPAVMPIKLINKSSRQYMRIGEAHQWLLLLYGDGKSARCEGVLCIEHNKLTISVSTGFSVAQNAIILASTAQATELLFECRHRHLLQSS